MARTQTGLFFFVNSESIKNLADDFAIIFKTYEKLVASKYHGQLLFLAT